MKGRKGMIQLAILVVLGAAVVASMALPQISAAMTQRQSVQVSVLIRDSDSSLWAKTRRGMEQAAGDMGAELRFLTPGQDNDPAEQEEMLRREVERGTDVMVVNPVSTQAVDVLWEEIGGDVPLVALESRLEDAGVWTLIDDETMGDQLAQAVSEDYLGGLVLVLDLTSGVQALDDRRQMLTQELTKSGIPWQLWSAEGQPLEEWSIPREVTHIVALDPAGTQQMLQVCADREDILCYGVGAAQPIVTALEQGRLAAAAVWNEYALGYLAVAQAARLGLGEGQTLIPDAASQIIRGEDIYEPEIQKLLFPLG